MDRVERKEENKKRGEMERSHCSGNKSGLKKGAWTPEEDRKLTAYITRYGSWNWRQLPKFAGLSRCGKSCRLRWLNYLRPNIKRGDYSKDEEDTIIRLHQSLGNRWSAIAAQLPGRTDNEIKNHWHTNLKKRANVKLNLKQKKSQETDEHPTPTAAGQTMSLEMEQPQVEELHSNLDATVDNDHLDELIIGNNTANAENFSSIFGELEFPGVDDQYHFDLLGVYNNNNNNNIIVAPSTCSSGDFWTEPFLCDNYCYNMAGDHQDELLVDQYSDSAILDHEDTTGPFSFSSGLLHDDYLLNYCTTI